MTRQTSPFSWTASRDALGVSDAAQQHCDLFFDLEEEHFSNQLDYGCWWVLPFARDEEGVLYGIRLLPGSDAASSPVVRLMRSEAVTLVSRAAYLVPFLLFRRLQAEAAAWKQLGSLGAAGWSELALLHRVLGGTDDLKALREVVADAKLRAVFTSTKSNVDERLDTKWQVFARLDPTPETARYRTLVHEALNTRRVALPLPDVGCWTPALASTAFVMSRLSEERDAELAAAWEVMQWPGLDGSHKGAAQLLMTDGLLAARNALEAARTLVKRKASAAAAWKKDPLWPAVEAMVKKGSGYLGEAHLEAARALEAAGQPVRAWAALQGAAFWAGCGEDPVPLTSLDAAEALAKRAGWKASAEMVAGWREHHVPADDDE